MRRQLAKLGALLTIWWTAAAWAEATELPRVPDGDWPGMKQHLGQLLDALDGLGAPLPDDVARRLRDVLRSTDAAEAMREVQEALDARCLIGVHVNPESRVKGQRGPALALLQQGKQGVFLLKVHNEAGVTQALKISGQHVATTRSEVNTERWLAARTHFEKPLPTTLTGRVLQYVIVILHAEEAGKREATLVFDVGQGTQDLGFRAEVPVLFAITPK